MTHRTRLAIAALALLLQGLDVVSTHLGLAAGAQEVNIVPAYLLHNYGEAALYAVKALAVLVMAGIVWRLRAWALTWRVCRVGNVVMVLVVAVNLTALL
jgi:hypothetical protein